LFALLALYWVAVIEKGMELLVVWLLLSVALVLSVVAGQSFSTTFNDVNVVLSLGADACSDVLYTPSVQLPAGVTTKVSIAPYQVIPFTITGSSVIQGTAVYDSCSVTNSLIATDGNSATYIGYSNFAINGPSAYYFACLTTSGCSVTNVSSMYTPSLGSATMNANWTLPSPVALTRGQVFVAFVVRPTTYASGTTHVGLVYQSTAIGIGSSLTLDGSTAASSTVKLSSAGGIVVREMPSTAYSLATSYTTPTSYFTYNSSSSAANMLALQTNAYGSNSQTSVLTASTVTFVPVPTAAATTGIVLAMVYSFTGTGTYSSAFLLAPPPARVSVALLLPFFVALQHVVLSLVSKS